jgi:hypothetical protein
VVEPAADLRVLAFVVLTDDDEVDLLRSAIGQRRPDARQQADGPQVHVLAERAPDRDEEAPQRDVVGNVRPADGTQEDRVMVPDAPEPVLGHHPTRPQPRLAAPIELVPLESDVEVRADAVEHLDRRRHDLPPDAVSGDDRDPVARHNAPPPGPDAVGGGVRAPGSATIRRCRTTIR